MMCSNSNLVSLLTAILILATAAFSFGPAAPATADAGADLSITKRADTRVARSGEVVTYTITITNVGDATATGVRFGDALPDQLNFESMTCSRGVEDRSFCNVGSVAPGESVTATLVARVIPNPARSERFISNTAFVVSDNDPNPANDQASTRVTITGRL